MKPEIHPEAKTCSVSCACGSVFETIGLTETLKVDICGACHPFFTGKQRFVDTEGRIDKFQRKFGKDAAAALKASKKKKTKKPEDEAPKVAAEQV